LSPNTGGDVDDKSASPLAFGVGQESTAPLAFEPISTWEPGFVAAIRRHYTKSRGAPPGKKLAWRIIEASGLVGWIGLGEPAFKLAPRRRLGLSDARPAPFSVCCFIYRLEGDRKTAAHAILRAWHALASTAWAARYGWTPIHWETLVGQGDPANPGACFKRAGYRRLGLTTGRSARRPAGNTHGPRVWGCASKKIVLYRGPLARLAAARALTPEASR
jgi:hypothetical protein